MLRQLRKIRDRERGSMLIVALGVLTLMSLLAAAFVSIMNLEKRAAQNYIDQLRAQMTAEAGMERMIAVLKSAAAKPLFGTNGRLQPYIFGVDNNGREIDVTLAVDQVNPTETPFFWGYTGRTYSTGQSLDFADKTPEGVDEYKVKVVDTSALIDLNYPMTFVANSAGVPEPQPGHVFEHMLQALGQAIAKTNQVDPIGGAAWTGPGGTYSGARAILAYRASLEGQHYSSKTQLQTVMDEASYRLLRDFVTCHSWLDEQALQPVETEGHHVVSVASPRAQVNLNLAPREVLVACLAPLAGRRYVHMVEATDQPIESGNEASYFGTSGRSGDLSEDKSFLVREGWIYVGPIGFDRAEKIADWLVSQRPFKSQSDFQARLLTEMRKTTGDLDTFLPGLGGATVNPNEVLFFPKSFANPGQPYTDRYGLSAIHAQPFMRELVRECGYGLLMANFSPGFVSGSTNPNTAGWLPIDKGSLLFPVDTSLPSDSGLEPLSRQTLDACFDTRGVFEITALGQIIASDGQIVAQDRQFTVVRILDHAVQRTQMDFDAYRDKFRDDRFDMVSYPETQSFMTANPNGADLPPLESALAFGHMELAPVIRYDEDGDRQSLGVANFGNKRFGVFFEGPKPNWGMNAGAYLHADLANGQEIALSADPSSVWNRARGTAADYALGNTRIASLGLSGGIQPTAHAWRVLSAVQGNPDPSQPGVVHGTGCLFNDGFYSSYRRFRDKTLWFRAAAGSSNPTPAPSSHNPPENYDSYASWENDFDNDLAQGVLDPGLQQEIPNNAALSGDADKRGNFPYRRGGIEFWYKPDFDWSYRSSSSATPGAQPTPLACGYVFGSRVWFNYGLNTDRAHWRDPQKPMIVAAPLDPPSPSDGTQMVVFRNTQGQIRATRVFFRTVGVPDSTYTSGGYKNGQDPGERPVALQDPWNGDEFPLGTTVVTPGVGGIPGDKPFDAGPFARPPGDFVGAIERYREAAERMPNTMAQPDFADGYVWPPAEFLPDEEILRARTDAWVAFDKLKDWKRGEWHHVAIYWNDQATDAKEALKIYIDGQLESTAHGLPDAVGTDADKYWFVRLNEPPVVEDATVQQGSSALRTHFPKDHLFIGGLERNLADSGSGVFKYTNKVHNNWWPGTADYRFQAPVDTKKITLYAAGTVDDFITYDEPSNPGNSLGRRAERFQHKGTYANFFDLQPLFPKTGGPITLHRMTVTALLPYRVDSTGTLTYKGSVQLKVVSTPTGLKMRRVDNGSQVSALTLDNMLQDTLTVDLVDANDQPLVLWPPANQAGNWPEVSYELELEAATFSTTPGLANVDTPVVQEVGLSWYLPAAETLHRERLIE